MVSRMTSSSDWKLKRAVYSGQRHGHVARSLGGEVYHDCYRACAEGESGVRRRDGKAADLAEARGTKGQMSTWIEGQVGGENPGPSGRRAVRGAAYVRRPEVMAAFPWVLVSTSVNRITSQFLLLSFKLQLPTCILRIGLTRAAARFRGTRQSLTCATSGARRRAGRSGHLFVRRRVRGTALEERQDDGATDEVAPEGTAVPGARV